MKLTFVGSGDAFGSGGRFNTCFLVEHQAGAFLIDCGATSMVAMRRLGIDPNRVDTIFISHLHGDHFGGLPFFVLDAQFYSRRQTDITIIGPPGLGARLRAAQEIFFPGSADANRKFATIVHEIEPGGAHAFGGARVAAHEVLHACGAPAFGLRISCDGKTIAYSGDSEWTDALIELGRGADLFIAEALSYEKRITQHLDYASLRANEGRIGAKRIVLTDLGPDMLAHEEDASHDIAFDGRIIQV